LSPLEFHAVSDHQAKIAAQAAQSFRGKIQNLNKGRLEQRFLWLVMKNVVS